MMYGGLYSNPVPRFITLTTDFGLQDAFVGAMRGVILTIAPQARIIDITHEIRAHRIADAAYALASAVPFFPPECIHVCVVDPGVGSGRRPIAAAVGETLFVAPDNGVISLALEALQAATGASRHAVHLDNPQYWLARVSNTFHGRDIFAPVAAHLANGVPLQVLGPPLDRLVTLGHPPPESMPGGRLQGHIVYVDRFGNLLTDIAQAALARADPQSIRIEVGGSTLVGLNRSYADVEQGDLLALISSNWHLEVAMREGDAARALQVRVGDPVIVSGLDPAHREARK
jgi:S-adenosylmethionine hydrolase